MTSSKAWVGAIVAAVLAGLSSLAVVVTGDATLANVTVGQWIAVAIAVITSGSSTFGLVYHTSNEPAAPSATPSVTNVFNTAGE
jgi:hypothetical protein